ncbi:MAG TPA: TetR family transcriptional regulator, partial [Rugosimonospora sp.]|nr:TetR family transcriptional regulator [Rugosimonospora sp.]
MSPRTGRRGGESGTREAILAAARERFAGHGYDGTTMRAVAADAGVDPALLYHFYGSKEELFVAALQFPVDPRRIAEVLVHGGPRDELGQRLARVFLSVWGEPTTRAPFLALLRSATTNPQAATMIREFVTRALLARVAEPLGIPRLRLQAAVAQLFGIALLRYVVQMEPMASATEDEVVALVS